MNCDDVEASDLVSSLSFLIFEIEWMIRRNRCYLFLASSQLSSKYSFSLHPIDEAIFVCQ